MHASEHDSTKRSPANSADTPPEQPGRTGTSAAASASKPGEERPVEEETVEEETVDEDRCATPKGDREGARRDKRMMDYLGSRAKRRDDAAESEWEVTIGSSSWGSIPAKAGELQP